MPAAAPTAAPEHRRKAAIKLQALARRKSRRSKTYGILDEEGEGDGTAGAVVTGTAGPVATVENHGEGLELDSPHAATPQSTLYLLAVTCPMYGIYIK